MLDQAAVRLAARGAGIDSPARFLAVTGSTNSDLLRLAEDGAPEWTVIVAGHQEAGRGRLGRPWFDTPGTQLPVSVLLRPAMPPAEAFVLSLAAAVAMSGACQEAAGVEVRCKWPNDLVVGDRKLAGILTEGKVEATTLSYVVLGVGVNVAQKPEDFPPELRGSATSLAMEGGDADPARLLAAYLKRLRNLLDAAADLRTVVLDAYRPACQTLGRVVRARTVSGAEVEGRAVAIAEDGGLLVETPEQLEAVRFGEVAHLQSAASTAGRFLPDGS